MKNRTLTTNNHLTGLIIRLTLGIVLFPHGAQKMLGWFGGPGFTKEMEYLQHLNLPWIIAFLVIIIEFFGAISLIVGFASRIWSALTIILFMGIIFTSHLEHGFFMNWSGNQKGEGYEYHLLVLGICMALLVTGGGKFSFDNLIVKSHD